MNWLALDVGGANLKVADGKGYAATHAFAMWQDFQRLAVKLRGVIAEAPRCDHLAVTMTGELADCFDSKTEGVQFILQAIDDAADGRHTRVYLTDGTMVAPQVALAEPLMAASSNWHALATFCGRFIRTAAALLIDVGSTTVDLIPFRDGRPVCLGHTDTDRLLAGELVYTGVERSPVCAVVHALPYRGRRCPVAQEVFATTRDVYLLLGDLPENATDHHTADHRAATKQAACRRMGRMLSANDRQYDMDDAVAWATEVADQQKAMLLKAARQVRARLAPGPTTTILSGQGEFLGRWLAHALEIDPNTVSLLEQLGPAVSRSAPAHALAVLARESTAS